MAKAPKTTDTSDSEADAAATPPAEQTAPAASELPVPQQQPSPEDAQALAAAVIAATSTHIPVLPPTSNLSYAEPAANDELAPDEPSVFAQGSMYAERIYIVTAPGGPRRRAGFGFGPEPVELTTDDLGDVPDAVIEAIRADPKLKLDGRYEERPYDPVTDPGA